ncbi:MAG: histidine phosphatase family protein [Clostridia bacterium]
MKITFLRHAQTTANRDGYFAGRLDCHITDTGFKEASQLFPNAKFDAIYCSPLQRTSETLHAFMPTAKPIIDDRITEMDVGIWQGQYKEQITAPLIKKFLDGEYLPDGAESISETDARISDFISDMFNSHNENDNILVVTHNGSLRSVKRLFANGNNPIMSKNLETFTIDSSDFQKYKK